MLPVHLWLAFYKFVRKVYGRWFTFSSDDAVMNTLWNKLNNRLWSINSDLVDALWFLFALYTVCVSFMLYEQPG